MDDGGVQNHLLNILIDLYDALEVCKPNIPLLKRVNSHLNDNVSNDLEYLISLWFPVIKKLLKTNHNGQDKILVHYCGGFIYSTKDSMKRRPVKIIPTLPLMNLQNVCS